MAEDGLAFFEKASAAEKAGHKERAEQLYSISIDAYQQSVHLTEGYTKMQLALAHNNRGFMRYLQVEFVSAVKDYTKAIEYNPCLAVAYYNKGLIHYRLGHFKNAICDQSKALELDPKFVPAELCLAQAKKDLAGDLQRGVH